MKPSSMFTIALALALSLPLAACNRHSNDSEPAQIQPGGGATVPTPAPGSSVPTPGSTTAANASSS